MLLASLDKEIESNATNNINEKNDDYELFMNNNKTFYSMLNFEKSLMTLECKRSTCYNAI